MCPLLVLMLVATPAATDAPLAEKYLHSGHLALGEQALERELKARPKDDQARFGLGIIRIVRGFERLGQSLYEHGAGGGVASLGIPRLPLPQNPEPGAITYIKFRRILDDFRRDLDAAESTLAGVTDDRVTLPLRLEPIRLDFDGDGKATDSFLDVVRAIVGPNLDLLKKNPSFFVRFDRGDVAWFRSYCHLLMGLTDFALAFDFETEFRLNNHNALFPEVRPKFRGDDAERNRLLNEGRNKTRVAEPARLGRFREHLLQMPKLNRETWRFIRAETDDDYEWLPNARQKSVIGLPIRDNMVDAWLRAMDEFEGVLSGKKLLPVQLVWKTSGQGLNLKSLLDDPPAVFDFDKVHRDGVDEKYLGRGNMLDLDVILDLWRLLDGPGLGMYAPYFN